MDGDRREGRRAHDQADTIAAARVLRSAALLHDPGRRADAVWDALRLLRPPHSGVTRIASRLEDDGRGEAPVSAGGPILAAARDLERLASTAAGVGEAPRTDPGRFRTHALRADSPTTGRRRRRRHPRLGR